MPNLHVEIEGHVQGVGYRWYVRECAQKTGVNGWVLNRDDGSVEVAARGGDEALNRFRADLATGPRGASVAAVRDLQPLSDDEFGDSFTIRR